MVNELFTIFTDFYLFLSGVGLIRKSDAQKIKKYCEAQWENYMTSELDDAEDSDINFNNLENEIMEHPEKFLKIV